jgi:hypothetical protein
MVFAITTGRQGIMLRHTQGEAAGCKGHGGYVRIYACTNTQIRKTGVLTTLHVYRYVITKVNIT